MQKTNLRVFLIFVLCTVEIVVSKRNTDAKVAVLFDKQINSAIHDRVLQLLKLGSYPLTVIEVYEPIPSLPAGSILLSFGNNSITRTYIPLSELKEQGPEGFIIRSTQTNSQTLTIICGDGNYPDPNVNKLLPTAPTGLYYSIYGILEELGYGFMHPLNPVMPVVGVGLQIPTTPLDIKEKPYWPIRAWHYHTEHPLELTHLLNGWGMNGPYDEKSWNNMLPDFVKYLEWHVANRQNALEWIPLGTPLWGNFTDSKIRQQRFQKLTSLGEAWGVAMGADIPIAEKQQNGWYMTDDSGTFADQVKRIRDRVDWLVQAGFHFISTESGFSEFTHPNCTRMLEWMDAFATYTSEQYGKRAFIKAHISSGQTCSEYADPVTGKKPCNFNYLPHYAVPELGVDAHTVQFYTFQDPAPTYGNKNFGAMLNFTFVEAPIRETLYYGETAYWVNFDIDVPLFLPLYAQARLNDLRTVARQEILEGQRVSGQVNFESGWMYGYWLSNTITARASWQPYLDLDDDTALLKHLNIVSRHYGKYADELSALLLKLIKAQHDLLVLGIVDGVAPETIIKRNGQAYIQGWDTWAQLMPIVGMATQPVSYGIDEMKFATNMNFYERNVKPLLNSMATTFKNISKEFTLLSMKIGIDGYPRGPLTDITTSTALFSSRVEFVYKLYDSMWKNSPVSVRKMRLQESLDILREAGSLIDISEQLYGLPLDRVAGWGVNPTVYTYGYLWTVHSRYYWIRDLARVIQETDSTLSPCFMNIINPVEVALGEGIVMDLVGILEKIIDLIGGGPWIGDCLGAPKQEPVYKIPNISH